jgi:hypothetical protein
MKLAKFAPMLMVPVLAIGCAQSGDEDASANEGAASVDIQAKAGVDVKGAVGAVVVNGRKVCTAALVDVAAGASISLNGAEVSLSGRQIAMGKACIGKLDNGLIGGAAFVTVKKGVSLATPILSIDASALVSAGVMLGILAEKPQDTEPMIFGFTASGGVHAGASAIFRANEDGVLVGVGASAGFELDAQFRTKCTNFKFSAGLDIKAGAAVSLDDDGLGAAGVLEIDGHLHFVADIDGACILRQVKKVVVKIADGTLKVVTAAAEGLAEAKAHGAGQVIAVYDVPAGQQFATASLKLYAPARELKLNAAGRLSARVTKLNGVALASGGDSGGMECGHPIPAVLRSCELESNFKDGDQLEISDDTGNDILVNGTRNNVSVPR